MDFLYMKITELPDKHDDIIAEHFFKNRTDWSSRRKEPDDHHEFKKRINKLVAHLTFFRSEAGKKWLSTEVNEHVIPDLRLFVDLVPPEYLGNRWADGELIARVNGTMKLVLPKSAFNTTSFRLDSR